ncbi:MAG: hypothetical protein ABI380_04750 [Edaphobacter sp.]|jgi:hypothetical protein
MSYIRPQITGNFRAVSTIKAQKGLGHHEISNPVFLTNGAAYQADE